MKSKTIKKCSHCSAGFKCHRHNQQTRPKKLPLFKSGLVTSEVTYVIRKLAHIDYDGTGVKPVWRQDLPVSLADGRQLLKCRRPGVTYALLKRTVTEEVIA